MEWPKITFLFEDINSAFSNSATCSNNSLEDKSKYEKTHLEPICIIHTGIKDLKEKADKYATLKLKDILENKYIDHGLDKYIYMLYKW